MEVQPEVHQGRLAAISREVVVLLKNLVGRGPTRSKTYIHDDCVLILLREGHTKGEETMFEAGAAGRWRRAASTCRRRSAGP